MSGETPVRRQPPRIEIQQDNNATTPRAVDARDVTIRIDGRTITRPVPLVPQNTDADAFIVRGSPRGTPIGQRYWDTLDTITTAWIRQNGDQVGSGPGKTFADRESVMAWIIAVNNLRDGQGRDCNHRDYQYPIVGVGQRLILPEGNDLQYFPVVAENCQVIQVRQVAPVVLPDATRDIRDVPNEIYLAQRFNYQGDRVENMESTQNLAIFFTEPPMDARAGGEPRRGLVDPTSTGRVVGDRFADPNAQPEALREGEDRRRPARADRSVRTSTRTQNVRERLYDGRVVVLQDGSVVESEREHLKVEGMTAQLERSENGSYYFRAADGAVISVPRWFDPHHRGWNQDEQTAYTRFDGMDTQAGKDNLFHYNAIVQTLYGIPADVNNVGEGRQGIMDDLAQTQDNAERVRLAEQALRLHVRMAANPEVWSITPGFPAPNAIQVGRNVDAMLADDGEIGRALIAGGQQAELARLRSTYGTSAINYIDTPAIVRMTQGFPRFDQDIDQLVQYRASLPYTRERLRPAFEGRLPTDDEMFAYLRREANEVVQGRDGREGVERIPRPEEIQQAAGSYAGPAVDFSRFQARGNEASRMMGGFATTGTSVPNGRDDVQGALALLEVVANNQQAAQALVGTVRVSTVSNESAQILNFRQDSQFRLFGLGDGRSGGDVDEIIASDEFAEGFADAFGVNENMFQARNGGIWDNVARTLTLGHFGFENRAEAESVGRDFQAAARATLEAARAQIRESGRITDPATLRQLQFINRYAQGARDSELGAARQLFLSPLTTAQIETRYGTDQSRWPAWLTGPGGAWDRIEAGLGGNDEARRTALRRIDQMNERIQAGDIRQGLVSIQAATGVAVQELTGTEDERVRAVDAAIAAGRSQITLGATDPLREDTTVALPTAAAASTTTVSAVDPVALLRPLATSSATPQQRQAFYGQLASEPGMARYALSNLGNGGDRAAVARRAAIADSLRLTNVGAATYTSWPQPLRDAITAAENAPPRERDEAHREIINQLLVDVEAAQPALASARLAALQAVGATDTSGALIGQLIDSNPGFAASFLSRTVDDRNETQVATALGIDATQLAGWRNANDVTLQSTTVIRTAINPGAVNNQPLANILTNTDPEQISARQHEDSVLRVMQQRSPGLSAMLTARLLAGSENAGVRSRLLADLGRAGEGGERLHAIISDYNNALNAANGNAAQILAAEQALTRAVTSFMNPSGANSQAILAENMQAINVMGLSIANPQNQALLTAYVQSLQSLMVGNTIDAQAMGALNQLLVSVSGNSNAQQILAGSSMQEAQVLLAQAGVTSSQVQSTLAGRGISPYHTGMFLLFITGFDTFRDVIPLLTSGGGPITDPTKPIILDPGVTTLPGGGVITGSNPGTGGFTEVTGYRRGDLEFRFENGHWMAIYALTGQIWRIHQGRGGDSSNWVADAADRPMDRVSVVVEPNALLVPPPAVTVAPIEAEQRRQ